MLVVQVSRFGGPQVLAARQAPEPVAGPGQVVVRTTAADVLFVDTLIRSGRGVDFFPIRPRYIPGNGVAGRVSPVIGQTFPLAAAPDAHAALETRIAVAKTLLTT